MKNTTILLFLFFCGIMTAQVQIGQTIVATIDNDGTGDTTAINDDGTRIIVGSARTNNFAGEVRIYELNNNVWQQIGSTLTGTNASERFGFSVDISSTGDRIVIGSRFDAKVFEFTANDWQQIGNEITIPGLSSVARLRFSQNADILAASFNNGDRDAQVYQFMNNAWVEMGNGFDGELRNRFGLSSSGNRIVINGFTSPNAFLRIFDFISGNWVQVGNDIVVDTDLSLSTGFDISGNGNRVVFATGNSIIDEEGFIHTFEFNGTDWTESADVLPIFLDNNFGCSLRLSDNGNQFIIGIADDNPFTDYTYVGVYELQGFQWQQVGDLFDGSAHDETANGHVDITADGTKIIYGGRESAPGEETGFVAIYDFSSILSLNDTNVQDTLSLFPNPSFGTFTVDLGKAYSEINITISNVLGQVIVSKRFSNTNALELQIEEAAGIYFANISTPDGLSDTIKIIKK